MQILRFGEILPDQVGADHLTRRIADQSAVRLAAKQRLGDAGDRERIGQASEEGEERDHHDRRAEVAEHGGPLREADGGNRQVDELDADERRDDAAEAVDQEVAGQEFVGADRAGTSPRARRAEST